MKTAAAILALSSVTAATKFINGPTGWPEALGKVMNVNVDSIDEKTWQKRHRLDKRQAAGGGIPPKRQELPNRNPHIPGAKTVKIRYGPYTVPGAKVPGGEGMITNRPSPSVDKPCQNCYILGMNAGLEYPDGKDANTDTLMWLHHMVMMNIGKGAYDATCTLFGGPHLIVGSMPQSSERFFSSGNERTTTFFNPPWANVTNLGYPIYPADRFGLIVDLMNMNQQAKPAYLTIYYDYVEGHPDHFEEVKPVWMDAAQCGTSEVSGRTAGAKFDFGSPPWITNFEGEVMGAGGHLHDGGTKLNIYVDGKEVCSSVPTYGTNEEAKAKADIAKLGGLAPQIGGATAPAAPAASADKAAAPGHSHGRRQAPKGKPAGRPSKGARPAPATPAKNPASGRPHGRREAQRSNVASGNSAGKSAPKTPKTTPPKNSTPPNTSNPSRKPGHPPVRRQARKGKKAAGAAPAAAGDPPAHGAAGGHAMGGHASGQHIIAMSICAENKGNVKDMSLSPLGIKYLKKGQSWTLRAFYDYSKYPGMKNHNTGGQSSVMGISIMYAKTAKKRVAV